MVWFDRARSIGGREFQILGIRLKRCRLEDDKECFSEILSDDLVIPLTTVTNFKILNLGDIDL